MRSLPTQQHMQWSIILVSHSILRQTLADIRHVLKVLPFPEAITLPSPTPLEFAQHSKHTRSHHFRSFVRVCACCCRDPAEHEERYGV